MGCPMAYRKISFEYDLSSLHDRLVGLEYSDYIDVKTNFLNQARLAGYQEVTLQQFWQRVCRKLKKAYGYEKPLSNDWLNVRMRLYRERGTTRL
jgi:hypothetical protein